MYDRSLEPFRHEVSRFGSTNSHSLLAIACADQSIVVSHSRDSASSLSALTFCSRNGRRGNLMALQHAKSVVPRSSFQYGTTSPPKSYAPFRPCLPTVSLHFRATASIGSWTILPKRLLPELRLPRPAERPPYLWMSRITYLMSSTNTEMSMR